jgi:hypothetical protein
MLIDSAKLKREIETELKEMDRKVQLASLLHPIDREWIGRHCGLSFALAIIKRMERGEKKEERGGP